MAVTPNLGLVRSFSDEETGADLLAAFDNNMQILDGRIIKVSATLLASSWVGSEAPYTLSIVSSSMTENHSPIVFLDTESEEFSKVTSVNTTNGFINFEASDIPTEDLSVTILGVR